MVLGYAVGAHGHERHRRSLLQWIHPQENPYPPLWIVHWAPERRKPLSSLMMLSLLFFSSLSLLEMVLGLWPFLSFFSEGHCGICGSCLLMLMLLWLGPCPGGSQLSLGPIIKGDRRGEVSCKNKPKFSKNLIGSNLGENPLEVSNTEMHQVSFVFRKQSPVTAIATWYLLKNKGAGKTPSPASQIL